MRGRKSKISREKKRKYRIMPCDWGNSDSG